MPRYFALAPLALLCLLAIGCGDKPITVHLGQTTLQDKVKATFPIERKSPSATVKLENPTVTLVEGTDRVGLGLDMNMSGSGRSFDIQLELEGALTYDGPSKTFRIKDTKVTKLEAAGVPPSIKAKLEGMVADAVSSPDKPIVIHTLEADKAKDAPDTFVLKSANVETGVMKAVIGPPDS